jgi:DNA processing protein
MTTITSTKPALTVSADERLASIQLIRSQNVGPKTFFQLMKVYGTTVKSMAALPELAKRGGAKKFTACSKADAQKELDACTTLGGHIITFYDEAYPPLLKHIADPPPIISVLGDVSLLHKDSIGMVGARNASTNGSRLAAKFAKELGEAGYVIASGLARGIDTAAHHGSLATGTIAVIAGGIDIIYPKENTELYERIREVGCIVAECAFGTVPQAKNFPRRNRIISGLSLGSVIVEAAKRSGSLITARMANEQGREVMAVPGFPLDPRAEGPNDLIKQGATLITSTQDVIDAVKYGNKDDLFGSMNEQDTPSFTSARTVSPTETELDRVRGLIIEKLGHSAVLVDDLIAECTTSANTILTLLLELELAGRLERHPGNQVSLLIEV